MQRLSTGITYSIIDKIDRASHSISINQINTRTSLKGTYMHDLLAVILNPKSPTEIIIHSGTFFQKVSVKGNLTFVSLEN